MTYQRVGRFPPPAGFERAFSGRLSHRPPVRPRAGARTRCGRGTAGPAVALLHRPGGGGWLVSLVSSPSVARLVASLFAVNAPTGCAAVGSGRRISSRPPG